jgi:hypothetical protein
MDNDIIDLSLDFENLDGGSNNWNNSKTTNFGSGIELLMNEKKTMNSGMSSDIDLDDLNNLEEELNDLANDNGGSSGGGGSTSNSSGFFNMGSIFEDTPAPSVRFDDKPPSMGQSTSSTASDSKTWDGFQKFNNIPINPDRTGMSSQPKLSKDDLLREKFKFLRRLEALEKKGVELTKKYNMDSDLAEMQGEYEMIMEEKTKQNSVKFQGNMMMAVINGIEFLNNRFDPFDVKIDGWGEQINENINDYDDVFGELYEKYKSKATLAPELKLMFQLGGSAMMVHMTNTMFKSAMPGMDDIMRQNPDLMRQFQSAAVNSMGNTNPGFAGFMGGLMNPEPAPTSRGPPPPPLATQNQSRSSSSFRPDPSSMSRSSLNDDGISIRESNFGVPGFEPPQNAQKSVRRADMKGPGDINDILSGLKTKTINIAESSSSSSNQNQRSFSKQDSQGNQGNQGNQEHEYNNSTISIDDLKELQGNSNIPKKSKRKPKSDRNTVSLDI